MQIWSGQDICKFLNCVCTCLSTVVVSHVHILKWSCYMQHTSGSIVPKWPFVVSREWCWVAYVLPECWFISVPANFRFSICPLFSKGHAKIFREFRHDLCYKLGHIECPGFAAPGRSQHSCKTIVLFYVIIHFIRSRINWLDLIVGNMASKDEG